MYQYNQDSIKNKCRGAEKDIRTGEIKVKPGDKLATKGTLTNTF